MRRILVTLVLAASAVHGGLSLADAAPPDTVQLAKAAKLPELGSIIQDESTVAHEQWRSATRQFVEDFNAGDIAAAAKSATDALETALEYFGTNHPFTADSLNKIGLVFESRGDYDAAEEYYARSLSILEAHENEFGSELATSLNNLANINVLKDELDLAERNHLRALQIRSRQLGAESAPAAQSLFNLGIVYEKSGAIENAELLFKQAAVVWSKVHGPTNLNVASSYNKLAGIYASEGRNNEAEQLHLRALQIRQEILGADHIAVAESLMGVGRACTKQEKYDEAGPMYRQAAEIIEAHLGANDPRLAVALYSLANVYHIQAKLEDAFNRDIAAKVEPSGTEHGGAPANNDTLNAQRNSALRSQVRLRAGYVRELYERADPLYVRAASIFQKLYGVDHPTLKIINDELTMLRETMHSKSAMATISP